jgi:oligosaccharide repeat unit polymerase
MLRSLNWFVLIFYLLPFCLTASSQYAVGFFQVIIVIGSFYLGQSLIRIPEDCVVVEYKDYLTIGPVVLLLAAALYIILRATLILDVFTNIGNGTFSEWALQNAVDRYNGGDNLGALHNFGTCAFISYAVALGMLAPNHRKMCFYLILFLMFIVESFSLGRASILLAVVVLAIELVFRNNKALQELRFLKAAIGASTVLILVILVFGVSAGLRIGENADFFSILKFKLGEYTLASYQAFYIWSGFPSEPLEFGKNTFTSIAKIVFSFESAQGNYAAVYTDFGLTPIFTTMRGFLADFGTGVTAFLFGLFGWSIKLFTYRKVKFWSFIFLRTILFLLIFVIYSPFFFTTALIGFFFPYILIGLYIFSNMLFDQFPLRKRVS